MITISLCMIVKNEEAVLARCLDSVKALMDEIIIVDTGSTDRTKEIALGYTDRVYDFPWCDDFSAARNFSFSKASCDYIYAPDADEYLDEENRLKFAQVKEVLLPEIEIVQMHYLTKNRFNTTQNSSDELRPKLFKRLRTFTWIDPIHETVRIDPVVFDSDICIQHLPQSAHEKRDFSIFLKAYQKDGMLSKRIVKMYAKELFKCGTAEDFSRALPLFEEMYQRDTPGYTQDLFSEICCILVRGYRLLNKTDEFFAIALKGPDCCEISFELGCYYDSRNSYEEACHWYSRAAFETEAILDIEIPGRKALYALADCMEAFCKSHSQNFGKEIDPSLFRRAEEYRKLADQWVLPSSDS